MSTERDLFDPAVFRTLSIDAAGKLWLFHRQGKLAQGTLEGYAEHIQNLSRFFDETPLVEITAVGVEHYQKWRQTREGSPKRGGAGASLINRECSVLQQLMKRAGVWSRIRDWYEPLPLPRESPGRALDEERYHHLFEVAESNPDWFVACHAAHISANTTAGPAEIRNLKLGDCRPDYSPPYIEVRDGVKNQYRVRQVPLNEEARRSVFLLMDRARDKGCFLPSHYLIPVRAGGGKWNATRPASGWKTAWYALRKKVAEKYPDMATLRPYDMRHHAITSMLEDPEISERTAIEIAGHIGAGMLRRYSHIRMQAKVDAVSRLGKKKVV